MSLLLEHRVSKVFFIESSRRCDAYFVKQCLFKS